jgi:hypothetical protein
MLKEILENNKEKLGKIQINKRIYGKYSLSGIHTEYDKSYEPLPNQHLFLREEQVWTDLWKEYYPPEVLEELYRGVREYVMMPRISRFEYECKRYSKENIPDVFLKALDEESIFNDIELEDLFDLKQMKRKPKKRMLPKDSADVLSLTLKPKLIDSQDLVASEAESVEHGDFLKPLINILPSPNSLKDLVEFGVTNQNYAVTILWELMEHLYRNDEFNVLVLVDEFNELFKPSEYPSVKYINYKQTNGCIPPYDISLARLFMRFDGHMIKNGVKIVSVSEKSTCYTTTEWKGDPLNQGSQFSMEVQGLALDDLRQLIKYYAFFGWFDFPYEENDIATIHMLSQGNFGVALESITYSPQRTY